MSNSLAMLCESFVENRRVLHDYFGREDVSVYPICAAVLTDRQKIATEESLAASRELLKASESPSEFRGAAVVPVITMLAADEKPQEKLRRSVALFAALRDYFPGSPFLAITSMFASDMADSSEYAEVAERANNIAGFLNRRKLLDVEEDVSMPSTLFAIADMKNGASIKEHTAVWDAEVILSALKEEFYLDDALAAQSMVLAMGPGDAKERAARNVEFYDSLETKHYRLGDSYAYGVFALLSMLPGDISEVVEDLFRADNYLCNLKGYSGVFSVNKRIRLLHAAYIASIEGAYRNNNLWDAQQAALCIAIASSANNL